METVCSNCGERNAPEAQFCVSCNSYLGWDRGPRPPVPTEQEVDNPEQPSPSVVTVDQSREPFEAGVVHADLTVPVDGSPAKLAVNLANTSTTVDGYVVEVVDAPPWLVVEEGSLELLPGTQGVAEATVRMQSRTLVPAQQAPLLLRVRNTSGRTAYRDLPVRVTVPVVEAPVTVRAEPRLIRTRGLAPGVCTVIVDNSGSNRWTQVRLSAHDPERVVRATWVSPQLQVPPGGEARTEVRLDAPPPGLGGEVSRTITVAASDGRNSTETTVTLVQSVSQAAIELLGLRLDPEVLRLGGGRRGHLTAVVDNRRGAETAQVSVKGDDPENSLRFSVLPSALQVAPGSLGSVRITVTAPRGPAGREVTRPFMVMASDGRTDIRADGSVVQLAPSHRGLARVLLTVLGALAIAVGTTLPFASSGSGDSAIDLSALRISRIAADHDLGDVTSQVQASGVGNVVSLGLVLVVLAALVLFGLTGQSGRLSRVAALFAAILTVAALVALGLMVGAFAGPASGGVLILVGCVLGYAGGLLGRR